MPALGPAGIIIQMNAMHPAGISCNSQRGGAAKRRPGETAFGKYASGGGSFGEYASGDFIAFGKFASGNEAIRKDVRVDDEVRVGEEVRVDDKVLAGFPRAGSNGNATAAPLPSRDDTGCVSRRLRSGRVSVLD